MKIELELTFRYGNQALLIKQQLDSMLCKEYTEFLSKSRRKVRE
jgi:hypothetical protein